MTAVDTVAADRFAVVVNSEEQYSIWPADRDRPAGWRDVGPIGDRDTCVARIARLWTDQRPRSLRDRERSVVVSAPVHPSATPAAGEAGDEPAIGRRPASTVELPLFPSQERWLIVEDLYPEAITPLAMLVLRLRGPLDTEAWDRAVSELVDRHESLRARFPAVTGDPVQVIGPRQGLRTEHVDVADLPADQREARVSEWLTARMRHRFDLRTGPLVASYLLRLDEQDHVWAFSAHHIVADGVSLAVINRELRTVYASLVAGAEPDLPELPIEYGDAMAWHAAAHPPRYYEELREYWRGRLAGVPPLEVRTDRPRPAVKAAPTATVRHLLDEDLAAALTDLAGATRGTRFIVLLAALQVLLGRWSGQDDFCIGIPVAGSARDKPELAGVVGLFSGMFALRADLSGDPTFAEVLTRTRATLLDAVAHQDYPFGRVVTALEVPYDPGRVQLCQAIFGFDDFRATESMPPIPGLEVEHFPVSAPRMPYDLMIHAGARPDGLWTQFVYDSAILDQTTVSAAAAEYEQILRAAVAAPDTPLSRLLPGERPARPIMSS